jgi:hypothetical protein
VLARMTYTSDRQREGERERQINQRMLRQKTTILFAIAGIVTIVGCICGVAPGVLLTGISFFDHEANIRCSMNSLSTIGFACRSTAVDHYSSGHCCRRIPVQGLFLIGEIEH